MNVLRSTLAVVLALSAGCAADATGGTGSAPGSESGAGGKADGAGRLAGPIDPWEAIVALRLVIVESDRAAAALWLRVAELAAAGPAPGAPSEITRLRGRAAALQTANDELRAATDDLESLLHWQPPVPGALADHGDLADAYVWVENARFLRLAPGPIGETLRQIPAETVDLAEALLEADIALRSLTNVFDDRVVETRAELTRRLIVHLAGSGTGVARDFLGAELAGRTRALLDEIGWPVRELVEQLVRLRPASEGDRETLRRALLDALTRDDERIFAGQGAAIGDLSTVVSVIEVPARTYGSRAEVSVQIRHPYRGDLHVRLEAGSVGADGAWVARFQWLLHDQTGEGARDIRRVYEIDMPGYDVSGTFRLVVEDRAEGDAGRLESWELGFTIPSLLCQERVADDTEATAADRGDVLGCGDRTWLYGGLAGASDVDWGRIMANDRCEGSAGVARLVDVAVPATARLCIYAECLSVAAGGPSFTCEVGSPERSPGGRPGCGGPAAGGGPAVRMTCVPGGAPSLATYYVSVTDRGAAACVPYSMSFQN